jgi:hypothetical protein
MKKLALKLDDLNVQSFHPTPPARDGRGTVQAHESGTYDEQGCTDACSLVLTCYSCETCEDACAPADTVDPNRRIIVY